MASKTYEYRVDQNSVCADAAEDMGKGYLQE